MKDKKHKEKEYNYLDKLPKVVRNPSVFDNYLYLADVDGNIIPGQVGIQISDYVEEQPTATVKFLVDLRKLKS
jgi:hypothetical protein